MGEMSLPCRRSGTSKPQRLATVGNRSTNSVREWQTAGFLPGTPLIISVPGKKPAVCHSLTELVDLFPTVASLCGFEVPERLQGKDISPMLDDPRFGGVFKYIQEFQGYISPGILGVFVFGMIFKRAPAAAGVTGLLLTVPVYGFLQWQFGGIAFLNRMAITFAVVLLVMGIITLARPLSEPKVMPVREGFDMKPAKSVVWLGAGVIVITLVLYVIFW